MSRPITNAKRDKAIADLHQKAHWSQSAIARLFKISRQRVHQIIGVRNEGALPKQKW